MKHFFTLTYLFIITSFVSRAALDTTKVLFVGNSLTYTYDVPAMVQAFADKAGLPFKYAQHTPGGVSVGDVKQDTFAHMNSPSVYALIRSDKWDYLVIQDNQGRFVYGNGKFPKPSDSKVIEGHIKIRDSLKYYSPCARMVFFSGWAWKNGYAGIATTGKELIDNIYENYVFLNDSMKEIISPIGPAWLGATTQVPTQDLWGPDETHQSISGSYVTAAVIFSSIFRVNTENINYNSSLNPDTAKAFRRIAYRTVMDSISQTKLSDAIPALSYAGGTFTTGSGYTQYEWFKNNTLLSGSTTNTLASSGFDCYYVITTDGNNCKHRSQEYCLYPTGIQASPVTQTMSITPNPTTGIATLFAGNEGVTKHYLVTDITGNTIESGNFTSAKHTLSLPNAAPGMYFVNISMNGQTQHMKLHKTQ